jgi:DNA-binding NarL/FixJ family response regulator
LKILLLAARGLSKGQIASSLHLSEATVKRPLANIYPKMGVGSRGEASREALLRDWITIEDVTERAPGEGG